MTNSSSHQLAETQNATLSMFFFTGLVRWFGYGGVTHIMCLGQKKPGAAHLSPGLQQSFPSKLVDILNLKSPVCSATYPYLEGK